MNVQVLSTDGNLITKGSVPDDAGTRILTHRHFIRLEWKTDGV